MVPSAGLTWRSQRDKIDQVTAAINRTDDRSGQTTSRVSQMEEWGVQVGFVIILGGRDVENAKNGANDIPVERLQPGARHP